MRALIRTGKVRTTFSARAGGAALGFDLSGMLEVVMALTAKDFYKKHDHARRSQDLARRVPAGDDGGCGLLKLTVINDLLIVSFKENGT